MVDLIIRRSTGNLIPNGTARHIKPLEFIDARDIFALTDDLDTSNTWILPRIFGKALRFSEIVLFVGTMRL